MDDLLTIAEVSRRSGVASSALRFYEGKGLVISERSGRGHRRFRRAVLRRIAFIVFAQKIGLSLEEIREELSKLPCSHCSSPIVRRDIRPSHTRVPDDHWASSRLAWRA